MKGTREVLQDDNGTVAPARPWRKLIRPVLSLALVAFLLFVVLPNAVDTTASNVSDTLKHVTWRELISLLGLWAAGVLVHSLVLTGALPGLSTRRAVTLNMTGSSVSNVVPFGGAVGMSLNYVMIRSWGMDATAFAAYTVVTNIWVILIKLALPVVAGVTLLATGVSMGHTMTWVVAASTVGLAAAISAVLTGLINRRAAVAATGKLVPLAVRIGRLLRRSPDGDKITTGVLDARDSVVKIFSRAWLQMAIGMAGWTIFQAALLWACMHAVGLSLNPAFVLAGYAVDRALTLIVITPGAAGFVETGLATVLVALGHYSGGLVLAGVVLYRAFSFALEIPVGGVWLGGWLLIRRRKRLAAGEETAA